jgi:hypothetical protein
LAAWAIALIVIGCLLFVAGVALFVAIRFFNMSVPFFRRQRAGYAFIASPAPAPTANYVTKTF